MIDVPGIAFKNEKGKIINPGVPEIVKDLNLVPFADYRGINFSRYGNMFKIPLMSSRGCINTCAFCNEKPNATRYRYRNAENLFDEVMINLDILEDKIYNFEKNNNRSFHNFFSIKNVKKIIRRRRNLMVPFISLNDSLINGRPDQLEKFCDLVIRSKRKFN